MYNNHPDIYDILNNEDPVIEGPIDTDALVKDIFDTDYSMDFNFNQPGKKKNYLRKYSHMLNY